MVKRTLRVNSVKVKTAGYTSLVRPIMDYCTTAWDPYANINITKLEAIQCSAARYITRNYKRTPGTVTKLLKQLKFEPLQDRRRQLRLCMLFKIVNELVVVPHKDIVNLAQRRTRGSHCSKVDTMRANTDTLKYSFFHELYGTGIAFRKTLSLHPLYSHSKRGFASVIIDSLHGTAHPCVARPASMLE